MRAKKIKYDYDARDAIRAGVKKLTHAVKVTIGPPGRNVILDSRDGLSICMSAARVAGSARRPSPENRYSQGDCAGSEKSRWICLAHTSGHTMRHKRRGDKILAYREQIHSRLAVELRSGFHLCAGSPKKCHPVSLLSKVLLQSLKC